MTIKCGERQQMHFLPPSIEEYVSPDDPVRAYDAFIEHCVAHNLIRFDCPNYEGRPEYDPAAMVKLLVYSYSYGIRSSRQIERACIHNLSYLWLMGGLQPDHNTIANFRKDHKELLKDLLKKSVRICVELNLIDGNVLFVDGTKMRANASDKRTWSKQRCEEELKKVDVRINQLLDECQKTDDQEQEKEHFTKMQKELSDQETLKNKIQKALEAMTAKNKNNLNLTDPDCAIMVGSGGKHSSYNVQTGFDDQHGLIVSSQPVSDAHDRYQLANQTKNANNNVEKTYAVACADAGYADTIELQKVEEQKTVPVVPSQTQALHQERRPFHHDDFKYDSQNDCYVCPEGHILSRQGIGKPGVSNAYRINERKICLSCPHFGKCTSSPEGRSISRLLLEDVKKRFEAIYDSPEGQSIYKKRKEKAEHPFGYIKRILKADYFLLRGLAGAGAEASILSTCFNLTRMITILGGVIPLIAQLKPSS
jgi:transposase